MVRRYLLTQGRLAAQAVASRSRDRGPAACNRLAGNRGPSPRLRLIAGEQYVAFVPGAGPGVIWKATPASALDQSSRGLDVERRSTATSCRSISSSAFSDADERPSSTSQPASRTKIR